MHGASGPVGMHGASGPVGVHGASGPLGVHGASRARARTRARQTASLAPRPPGDAENTPVVELRPTWPRVPTVSAFRSMLREPKITQRAWLEWLKLAHSNGLRARSRCPRYTVWIATAAARSCMRQSAISVVSTSSIGPSSLLRIRCTSARAAFRSACSRPSSVRLRSSRSATWSCGRHSMERAHLASVSASDTGASIALGAIGWCVPASRVGAVGVGASGGSAKALGRVAEVATCTAASNSVPAFVARRAVALARWIPIAPPTFPSSRRSGALRDDAPSWCEDGENRVDVFSGGRVLCLRLSSACRRRYSDSSRSVFRWSSSSRSERARDSANSRSFRRAQSMGFASRRIAGGSSGMGTWRLDIISPAGPAARRPGWRLDINKKSWNSRVHVYHLHARDATYMRMHEELMCAPRVRAPRDERACVRTNATHVAGASAAAGEMATADADDGERAARQQCRQRVGRAYRACMRSYKQRKSGLISAVSIEASSRTCDQPSDRMNASQRQKMAKCLRSQAPLVGAALQLATRLHEHLWLEPRKEISQNCVAFQGTTITPSAKACLQTSSAIDWIDLGLLATDGSKPLGPLACNNRWVGTTEARCLLADRDLFFLGNSVVRRQLYTVLDLLAGRAAWRSLPNGTNVPVAGGGVSQPLTPDEMLHSTRIRDEEGHLRGYHAAQVRARTAWTANRKGGERDCVHQYDIIHKPRTVALP